MEIPLPFSDTFLMEPRKATRKSAPSAHCLDSVWTCYTPFPCVRTVFEQPAMWWCAVQTLFEQFVIVWQCPNTVRKCSDITHCFVCCSNTVQTVFGHVILPFHAFEQCSNSPPCGDVLFEHCSNSLSLFGNVRTAHSCPSPTVSPFFFSFLSPLLFFFCLQPFMSAHKRIHARPSARSENQ